MSVSHNCATAVGAAQQKYAPRNSDILGFCSVILATIAICLPFFRAIMWLSDEGVLLHGAARILHGDRLYGDFFEFLPPGGFFITTLWFKLTGISFASARILAVLTIAGIAAFTYLASRRDSSTVKPAAILVVFWVILSQGHWTIVEYHWFATMFSAIAMWAILNFMDDQTLSIRWPLIAGISAGAAVMNVETCGTWALLAALPAFLVPRIRWVPLAFYIAGCAMLPFAILLYLIYTHSFLAAFSDIVLWPANHYASIQIVHFGAGAGLFNFPLFLFFPILLVLVLFNIIRAPCAIWHDLHFIVCAAFAVAGFLGCFPRPDVDHIAFNVPLGLPLFILCISRLRFTEWLAGHRVLGGLAGFCTFLAMIAILTPIVVATVISLKTPSILTPRGRVTPIQMPHVALLNGFSDIMRRIGKTPAGDKYFFYPSDSTMTFISAREDVSPNDYIVPYYTTELQYRAVCNKVMETASWVVVDRLLSDRKYLSRIYPAMPPGEPKETMRFENALRAGFSVVAVDGNFELRHRNVQAANAALCAGI